MARFRLIVEFDGGPFMGWQRQAHGPSVQQAIEEAARAITGERPILHAAGRTDAGVHALAMAAHLDLERPIAPFRLAEGLNARLKPLPGAVLAAEPVAASGEPGDVLPGPGLVIACGEGALSALLVQRSGRAPMSGTELLRGFPIAPGTTL